MQGAAPHRIVQITDCHLLDAADGRLKGCDTTATLTAVVDAVRAQGSTPDLVLLTGDLVHEAGRAAYERLAAIVARIGAPVACLPGNHDDLALFHGVLAPEPLPRAITVGAWRIVLLDSTLPGQVRGMLGPARLNVLDGLLRSDPDSPTLVALHHPPVRIGSAWLDASCLADGEALLDRLDRHPQVRAVLCGHIHQDFDAQRGRLRLLGTPSTAFQFAPRSADFTLDAAPPGWRVFDLYREGNIETWVESLPFCNTCANPAITD